MKALLIMFMLFSFLYAQGIDSLLSDYAQESELSKKTKDESAGNLIVYTRDDLERMQVETLKDILKSLRFFPYAENRTAHPDILNQDPLSYASKNVRIYLNETELLTSITGSGFFLFGDMEMDFINHVEIYEGFPSFDFGVEPATIVIRLYSKTAKHDEGGRVKATIDNKGSNKQNVYYSGATDDISYFLYANRTDKQQDTYEHQNETLGRDKGTNRFYGSLSTQNHTLELHTMQQSGDALLGSTIGLIPKDSNIDMSFLNLSTNSKFLDDSLILNLSYNYAQSDFNYDYNPLTSGISSMEYTMLEETFTSSLKKEWELNNNTITVGLQYRYKSFDSSDVKINNNPIQTKENYNETIYSAFIEDLIALNDKNLITLSVMQQLYKRNNSYKDEDALQLRFGYIFSDKEWVSKTFISSQEFIPGPYLVLATDRELKPETYKSIIEEISYQTDKTTSKIVLVYSVSENMPIMALNSNTPPKLEPQNGTEELTTINAALEFTLHFNKKDKLELQANYMSVDFPDYGEEIVHYNYLIRVLNTISKFDIYNELVINDNFTNVKTGYNYSVGVKYEVNRDFHINFKGDNIFDSALEWDYRTPTASNPTDTLVIPVIEQRFMLGMEYLF
ncbi:MAG: hypothetical protein U9Q40_03980 [Campylobacterota bacterium]|nr:hypothetical protein [Campylobacterota bacterium]